MSEKEKACLEVLIEAGCSEEWARGFLSLWKEGKVCEAMRILTERRRELLEKLHTDQRQLDCLDYFIYQMKKKKLEICSEEGKTEMERYIAPLNPKVERTHVRYKNRFGITLAGDLYVAKDMDRAAKHPALVIGAPYGGVKEQGPCVYAGELARRGFVALTFDPSFGGESGGEPRHTSSPEIFSEDFSAGVDFLGTLPYVDRNKMAALGICGSGGFAISAAQMDKRIRAVVTASMYDISRVQARGWEDSMTESERDAALDALAEQRWRDVEAGTPEYIPTFPETPYDEVPADITGVNREWFTFYATKRGHHPRARGNFTTTSSMAFMNYPLTAHIAEISPRPILFLIGDHAHSKWFSEYAYREAKEPKELYVVPDAIHIDLYDDTSKIPFDKIETFLREALDA